MRSKFIIAYNLQLQGKIQNNQIFFKYLFIPMLVLKQDDTVISVIYGDNGPGFLIDPDRLVDITRSYDIQAL